MQQQMRAKSSGGHWVENVLEFLPKSLASTAHNPSPPFCKLPAFTASPFHWSSWGKAWRETLPTPHCEHSARAHSARRVLWAARQPCRPSLQARDWCITAATPISQRGKLGRRVAEPAVEERQDRHSGGQLPDQGARWEEASCLGLLEHTPVQVQCTVHLPSPPACPLTPLLQVLPGGLFPASRPPSPDLTVCKCAFFLFVFCTKRGGKPSGKRY